jgi:uncharacterized protein YeaO (DUF488 family)
LWEAKIFIIETINASLRTRETDVWSMPIFLKRVYETPDAEDGKRILVERLWPRGLKKDEAEIDEWIKDVAPSTELRKWYSHDPKKWLKFKEKYWKELQAQGELLSKLAAESKGAMSRLFLALKKRN